MSEPHAEARPARTLFGLTEIQIAYGLLMTAPAMFGVNMLVARWMAETAPPIGLAFWRWFGVFLIMLLLRGPQLWKQRRDVLAEAPDLLLLGAIGMGVCGAFVYIGAHTTEATNIGLIYAAAPVLIILLAGLVYGERLTAMQLLGVGVCLSGVLWIIFRGDLETLLSLRFTVGDLWIVAGAIGWAVYVVLLKYRPSRLGMMTRFTALCGAGSLVLLPFYVWETLTGKPMPVTPDTLVANGLLIFVAGFGAYQAYAKAQAVLGASRGSLVMYMSPVYVAAMAWAFLGERLETYHLIGAALVLPGIWLANRTPRPRD